MEVKRLDSGLRRNDTPYENWKPGSGVGVGRIEELIEKEGET